MKQTKQDTNLNRVSVKMDDITINQLRKIQQHYNFPTVADTIRALIKRGSMNL